MDDPNAIAECQAGNAEAFRHLVERYQAEAFGHAVAIVGRREDALDAVQEAFIKAYRTLNRFDLRRRFYPWFFTILRHCCYKLLQNRSKDPTSNIEGMEIFSASGDRTDDRTQLLQQALLEMAAQDRELITLKHLDGLSYEELAERLGIPAGTVMSRLYYARKGLREKLARLERGFV
jgi:RNA polymerase sigma-70 factor (ECF subfamily)